MAASGAKVTLALGSRATLELGGATVEHWERIPLLPGLDLMLRSDAKEPARAVAQRICNEYVVK